ncbi:MAG: hypothetical protein ACKVQB_11900 [Bacteroidia bacterium]
MNKTIIIAVFIFSFCKTNGQSPALALEDMKHYRIQLDNRSNRHLLDVPRQLLEGYCKGIYKAYYPLAVFNEVNFGDFLAHFRWGEPVFNETVLCGDDYCSNSVFAELFNRFNVSLDFYEQNYYNTQTARMERKVHFIQLVYTMDVAGKVSNFKGPIFRMDEIEKTIRLRQDEANNAETQSIKYTFELGRFYAVEITEKDIKTKEKRTNQEDNFQEH